MQRQVVEIACPKILSLRTNPDETSAFLATIRSRSSPGMRLRVVAQGVREASPDGLMALAAALSSAKAEITGDLPADEGVADVFRESGVFDAKGIRRSWPGTPTAGAVFTLMGDEADGELAERCVMFMAEKLGRPGARLPATYRVLIECMANTVNHAGATERMPWYVHAHFDQTNQVGCYTFVDCGVGIVASLRRRLGQRLSHLFAGGDAAALNSALAGDVPSRTGLANRGRGLNGIRLVAIKGRIRRLLVIANRGRYDHDADQCHKLHSSYPGTVISWEVTASELR